MKIRLIFLLLLSILPLAACRRADITDVQRDPAGGVDISAQLSESDIGAVIADALAVDNPLLRDPQVDLQPGQIVVTGQHERRDGGGVVSGSLIINLSVQDGAVLAQVSESTIEGFDLSDARISSLNARIAERVAQRTDRENRQITVKSISITDTAVDITFNFTRA